MGGRDDPRRVGTAELLRFFTDAERFVTLDALGVAVIAVLLQHVDTRRGPNRYTAWPSIARVAKVARVSVNTTRDRLRAFQPWLVIRALPRMGSRQPPNVYDVVAAADEILRARRPLRQFTVIAGGRYQPPPKTEAEA